MRLHEAAKPKFKAGDKAKIVYPGYVMDGRTVTLERVGFDEALGWIMATFEQPAADGTPILFALPEHHLQLVEPRASKAE